MLSELTMGIRKHSSAMAEMPNDVIPKFQLMFFEDWCELYVEGRYLSVVNEVADLPAQAAESSSDYLRHPVRSR